MVKEAQAHERKAVISGMKQTHAGYDKSSSTIAP